MYIEINCFQHNFTQSFNEYVKFPWGYEVLPENLHWWLFAVLRECIGGARAPGKHCILQTIWAPKHKDTLLVWYYQHCATHETWVGDMTAGWEGGAAATFCLSLLKSKSWAKVDKLEMAPEWVIVLQTCTGRSCCSCCLLDAGVLTLTYIYTTRKG